MQLMRRVTSSRFFRLSQTNQFFCDKVQKIDISTIPSMKDFLKVASNTTQDLLNSNQQTMITHNFPPQSIIESKKFFIETYGCQMNESDTEIISAILQNNSFTKVENMEEADVILTNTCAIRDSAEEKVWKNIQHIKGIKRRDPSKIFGILGCMAERMKEKILERSNNIVDLIVGPDAYRDLPNMINILSSKEDMTSRYAINVQLSLEETYADIMPIRKSSDNIKAFLSVMRGCNNMCSFCIVPFTRGRERSRPIDSIINEVISLRDQVTSNINLIGSKGDHFTRTECQFIFR